jgi:TorA maturation chaperone TorD
VAAAGFALSRVLLAAPDRPFIERLADPRARKSWPLQDDLSYAVLRRMGPTTLPDEVRADWFAALGEGGRPVSLRESERLGLRSGRLSAQLDEWYAKVGMAPGQLAGGPADHLGIQIACLSHLAVGAFEAARDDERAHYDELIANLGRFFATHPAKYWEEAVDELELRCATSEMLAVCGLVRGFMGEIVKLVQGSP